MDESGFDALTRAFTNARSRRGALSALLGGTVGLLGLADTTARKHGSHRTTKKSCPPCQKRKHGKCRGKQPNDTVCQDAASRPGKCQDGSCVVSSDPPPDPTPTCPAGVCSKNSCGSGCACLNIGGGTRRCLAKGTCSGLASAGRAHVGPAVPASIPGALRAAAPRWARVQGEHAAAIPADPTAYASALAGPPAVSRSRDRVRDFGNASGAFCSAAPGVRPSGSVQIVVLLSIRCPSRTNPAPVASPGDMRIDAFVPDERETNAGAG